MIFVVKGISEEALARLFDYSFPGNVREVENIIERAVSLASTSEILPSDLPTIIYEKKTNNKKICLN
ncbi:MAG TPA: hypothetical protein HPP56_06775 [Nitrospirae bacterium]|nr:hypothetical protein [Nitrospirota bacterium]